MRGCFSWWYDWYHVCALCTVAVYRRILPFLACLHITSCLACGTPDSSQHTASILHPLPPLLPLMHIQCPTLHAPLVLRGQALMRNLIPVVRGGIGQDDYTHALPPGACYDSAFLACGALATNMAKSIVFSLTGMKRAWQNAAERPRALMGHAFTKFNRRGRHAQS